MNNLLVYSTTSLSVGHLALEKEILDLITAKYDNVYLLACSGQLNSCYFNRTHNPLSCAACYSKCEKHVISEYDFDEIIQVQRGGEDTRFDEFNSVQELMEASYKGVDIGRGVVSSMISILRNANFDLQESRDLIKLLLNQSVSLLDQVEQLIPKNGITDVLIFNGRFSESYPLMAYCQLHGIAFQTHDKGSDFNKYQLIRNATVHDLATRERLMNEKWNEGNLDENKRVATNWFRSKLEGTIQTETSYTNNQDPDSLPPQWDENNHNIVVFNSSEDEFKAIKDWNHDLYNSQNELIIRLAKSLFEKDPSIKLFLRFHPNLANISEKEVAELKQSGLSNLVVIEPESRIHSYSLMQRANTVLSFGSRTSIEASHLNKPSVIYGKSFYHTLNSLYRPSNFEELLSILSDKNLTAIDNDDYLKAALFLLERGEKAANTNYISKHKVEYKGKILDTPILGILLHAIKNMSELSKWKSTYRAVKKGAPRLSALLKSN